jgi:hypothetical protein
MSDKVQEALGRVISSGGQKKGRNQGRWDASEHSFGTGLGV